jgi:hypothetical protein
MSTAVKSLVKTDTDVRRTLLDYFYNRNHNAKSARSDKTGVAAKISVVRKELKESHDLTQTEIRRNLTYLISQGWVEEEQITKKVRLPSGMLIDQATSYYKITAAGIDKVDGPGEFTMDKFKGIKIESSGQNIITVGDGNQVNASFSKLADALAEFKEAAKASPSASEAQKMEIVADVDSIQSQLAKPAPNKGIIDQIWDGIGKGATLIGLAAKYAKVSEVLKMFF